MQPMTSTPNNQIAQRRFVVLLHALPTGESHFDLMIEDGDALATWRVDSDPALVSTDRPVMCTRIDDHRPVYLDYEGPVSRNRGDVRRHDSGTCIVGDLSGSLIQIRFQGKHLIGDCELAQVESSRDQWRLRLA